jgi:hypothetical protein
MKINDKKYQTEDKDKYPMKGKAPVHYIVSHCNIGVTKYLFNTSFASWGDAWLLDTGTTSHMKF